jgi:4,5-dihydroxyphthalate decarboxylase
MQPAAPSTSAPGSEAVAKTRLSIACYMTDRSRPLFDGRVTLPDFELAMAEFEPEDMFRRALNEKSFEITELSMGSHITLTARGDSPYMAVPVFLSRVFRHSAIFVRTDRGIKTGADLAGRRIGVPEYQQTAGVWVRGILRDEYGVDTKKISWRTGGQEKAGVAERIKVDLAPGHDVAAIGPTQTLNQMLADGEIDAIFSPRPPSCYEKKTAPVDRLFPDYMTAEKEYFRKTRFFPIMHALTVRKDIAEKHPTLPKQLFEAFTKAKALSLNVLSLNSVLRVSLPWVPVNYADARAVMGNNVWPYGFAENREEIAAMTRYVHDDGLARRNVDPAELFHPSTLELRDVI